MCSINAILTRTTTSNIATFFSYRAVGAAAGAWERVAGLSLWLPSNTSSAQTVTKRLPPSGSLSVTAGRTLERSPLPALSVLTEPLRKLAFRSTCEPIAEKSPMHVTCVLTRHRRRCISKTTCTHTVLVQNFLALTAPTTVQDMTCCSSICRTTVTLNNFAHKGWLFLQGRCIGNEGFVTYSVC